MTTVEKPPTDVQTEPRPPVDNLGRVVFGAALIVAGLLWVLDLAGVVDLDWGDILPGGLVVVGLMLIATARRGARGGFVALTIVLTVLVLLFSALVLIGGLGRGVTPLAGVGDRVERPTSIAEIAAPYELGMGTLRLDLRGIRLAEGTEIEANVGMGGLQIRLPEGVGAAIEADVGLGEVDILGRTRGGAGVSVSDTVPGEPQIRLTLSVGMGDIEVRR